MPEPIEENKIKIAPEEVWAAYNLKMAALFTERNKHPMDSPEREAAAQAILALWVAQG